MIADLVVVARRPAVDVNVLCFNWPQGHSRGDENVVKLLVEVLVHVCVPLNSRNKRKIVNLEYDAVEGREDRAGLDEFVPVSGKDDTGKRINIQEGLDKSLGTSSVRAPAHSVRCQDLQQWSRPGPCADRRRCSEEDGDRPGWRTPRRISTRREH